MHLTETVPDTRHRLLHAAGEVFAERGFRAATIREIVERAGANVAAVNYHFGDKEHLYDEVLALCCRGAVDELAGGDDARSPEAQLRAFVEAFLARCLGGPQPAWQWQLMTRELSEPTPALDRLVERVMRPAYERLVPIVQGVAAAYGHRRGAACSGPRGQRPTAAGSLTEQQAHLCAQSIIAQCVHQRHAAAAIARLGEPFPAGESRADVLAEHIFRFSLAAIAQYPDSKAPR